ncbi:MAG: SRPBCC domain-containing protein [Ignavibacteria bacterium]|jgi:uncharacterized protein YndB with AHSA1/START domain|nr:SRPBCC domain-containing protein [Ignavibacteria bacterium]MDH7528798.1 SRPBCC domain-containing protein [Ignavibacteria bacterium]NPV10620.1 polyketide cyclase [Ignavibacteria bacterium]
MEGEKQKIKIEVFVRRPVEEVWEYFTDSLHIRNWNFASDDWHCPFAENELKPGGRFRYTMASKDGKYSFDFSGTFVNVALWKFLSYRLDDGRLVEINFDQSPKGTLITEIFEAENVHSIEQQKLGWQSILNNFKIYSENK